MPERATHTVWRNPAAARTIGSSRLESGSETSKENVETGGYCHPPARHPLNPPCAISHGSITPSRLVVSSFTRLQQPSGVRPLKKTHSYPGIRVSDQHDPVFRDRDHVILPTDYEGKRRIGPDPVPAAAVCVAHQRFLRCSHALRHRELDLWVDQLHPLAIPPAESEDGHGL